MQQCCVKISDRATQSSVMLFFYYYFIHGVLAYGVPPSLEAKPPNFYDYTLERLDSFSKQDLSGLKGKVSLWVLFQPECKSCESQFNDLSCLKDKETVAVGFWGSRENLNQVIRFSKFKGKTLMANKSFEKVAELKQTPTILILNKDGYLKKSFFEKTPCSTLKKMMETL